MIKRSLLFSGIVLVISFTVYFCDSSQEGDQPSDDDNDDNNDSADDDDNDNDVSDDDDDDDNNNDDDNNDNNNNDDDDIDTDGLFSNVTWEVHSKVATMLVVQWAQEAQTDKVWLEFTFEDDEWYESPGKAGEVGDHEEVILGVPERTEVTFRLVFEIDGKEGRSESFTGTTGDVPSDMPLPTIKAYDASLASANRWMFGGVEATRAQMSYYQGPFWIYIIDRKGRVVWYYNDPLNRGISAFPRITRDNTYIGIETRGMGGGDSSATILLLTLDFEYQEEIQTPNMCDCWDFTDEGTIIYNTLVRSGGQSISEAFLVEQETDGTIREFFDVLQWAQDNGAGNPDRDWVYSNTVNWDPKTDTVLLSNPYHSTVTQIDRQTGDIVAQWGDLEAGWSFEPSSAGFEFNHYPNLTDQGNLILSSHLPGEPEMDPGEHRLMEFELDEGAKVLREVWTFGEGLTDWPMWKGMAMRLPGGNTLGNYGTGGIIREVTPDKQTAWHVVWEADFGDEYYNRMAGHNILIDDLYALCQGPKEAE